MALPRQMKEVSFGAGLNTKGDARAQPEQLLDVAVNVEFDDIGGLRCRYPFDTVRTNILGGGTISNARRLAMNGDELVLFTKDSVYSWSARDSAWVLKGTHLAVNVTEQQLDATTDDQVDLDRAELGNTVVRVWTTTAATPLMYVSARDKATGAVILPPTTVAGFSGATRPRLVACSSKILLFYAASGGALMALAIDPANVSTSVNAAATQVVASGTFNVYYDVTRVINSDEAVGACRNATTTGYTCFSVTSAMSVATTTKASKTCDGPIAISCSPLSTLVQIARGNGTDVYGDLLGFPGFADSTVNQVLGHAGVAINQIAAAHRSVLTGGKYRCYVFWSAGEHVDFSSGSFLTGVAWQDTGGTIGGGGTLMQQVGVASRAFDCNGSVYVWVAFGCESSSVGDSSITLGQFQNAFYLVRDDAFLCAKASYENGAGLTYSTSRLPGVQLTSGTTTFSWCASYLRVIKAANFINGVPYVAFSPRSPLDVTFTLDSNEARRTARIGNTLYIACGEGLLQYDGVGICETGFHTAPYHMSVAGTTTGSVANGTYAWKPSYRWQNAQGETERSTSLVAMKYTVGGGPLAPEIQHVPTLTLTHKTSVPPAVEIWRTAVAPTADAPLYLVTSTDPSQVATNPNRYIANDSTAATITPTLNDAEADATATLNEAWPETTGVLESLPPPPCSIVVASDTRLFVAGVAGDPHRVWYSQLRDDGAIAKFNDGLTFNVPPDGGDITALGILEGSIIVWRETATYIFSGSGYDNTGEGSNYQLSRILSSDLGCTNQEAHTYFEDGFLVRTGKGWFLLDRQLNYSYVGEGVFKYDAETVNAMIVLTARHQVRILTSGRVLVYDTLIKQWAESSISDGLDLVLWNGNPAYLNATGVRAELQTWSGYAGTDASLTAMDVETGWIKFGDMQPRAIVDFVQLLGEYRSTCAVRVRVAKDYESAGAIEVWSYHTDKTWTPYPATVGSAIQLRQGPRWKRCEALKARFTVTATNGTSPLAGEGVHLTSLAIPFALEPNAYSGLAAAQKQ